MDYRKKSTRDYVTFIVPPELEFKPHELAHIFGVPTIQQDYHIMLDVRKPNFQMVEKLEERLHQLYEEMDFQVRRYKTSDDKFVSRMSPSEFALLMVQLVEEKCAKEGHPVYEAKPKHFDQPEDVEFPVKRTKMLPSAVDPTQILRAVVPHTPFKHLLTKNDIWRRILFSTLNASILVDAFWWLFLELFFKQDENTPSRQGALASSLMVSFREQILSIPQLERGNFIRAYPETLAKALYVAFHESFPTKGPQFGQSFKNMMARVLGKWTSSAPLAPRITRLWDPFIMVSDPVVPVLRNSLRAAVPPGDTRYDMSMFESDTAKLRKEENRFANEQNAACSTLLASGSRFRKKSNIKAQGLPSIRSKIF